MTDNVRADWHLSNWAEYMHHGSVGRGYPAKSIGMASNAGRIHTFDDLAQEVDDYCARVVDKIIADMPANLACALHNKYLAAVWRFRGEIPLEAAIVEFWERATKEGMV